MLAWGLQGVVAWGAPLLADEAYYLAWSRDLSMGYLDHPPGIAWWIAAGGGHPRLLGWLCMPVLAGALVGAARAWKIPRDRLWLWVAWTPLGMTLGLVATPDVPCLLAWSLALWALAARRPTWLGICVGLALWSKSTAVVALPGLIWVVYRQAGIGSVAIMSGVALTVYVPHLWWAWTHEGLPFSFQAGRLDPGAPRRGMHLLETLGGQIAVATPPVIWMAWRAWRRPADALDRQLRALGLPILGFWLAMSCVTRVEANWPALAWPATLILIARRPSSALPWAGAITVCALIGWGIVARWAPTLGPPRDPSRWAACVAGQAPVAARYQEMALLEAAQRGSGDPPVEYLRAAGHRPSEYDRRARRAVRACGFMYLAPPSALGGRCSGRITTRRVCGRTVTDCGCVDATKSTGRP